MAKRKRTDIVKLQLRIREGLRGRLESAAKNQERSLNSEIVARLEESFRRSELASLTENVRELSSFTENVRELSSLTEWVRRTAERYKKAEEDDARGRTDSAERDQEPELPMPHESASSRLLKEGKP
jgi:hypothetical protein